MRLQTVNPSNMKAVKVDRLTLVPAKSRCGFRDELSGSFARARIPARFCAGNKQTVDF